MRRSLALAAVLAIALILAGSIAAALSMEEAKKEFQAKGCTGCHNGALAPGFGGTVKKVQEWAKKYNSLDEAVAAEAKNFKMPQFQNAKTWDELMNAMPGITPELKEFFTQVFEQAKSGGAPAPGGAGHGAGKAGGGAAGGAAKTVTVTTTVTQTQVRTVTKTLTHQVIVTETVTPPTYDEGNAKLVAKAAYVVAILVAIAAVVLAYMFLGKKQ